MKSKMKENLKIQNRATQIGPTQTWCMAKLALEISKGKTDYYVNCTGITDFTYGKKDKNPFLLHTTQQIDWELKYERHFYPWDLIEESVHGGSEVKASASNVGDRGSIPGSGRSPGEGNGNPLPLTSQKKALTTRKKNKFDHIKTENLSLTKKKTAQRKRKDKPQLGEDIYSLYNRQRNSN